MTTRADVERGAPDTAGAQETRGPLQAAQGDAELTASTPRFPPAPAHPAPSGRFEGRRPFSLGSTAETRKGSEPRHAESFLGSPPSRAVSRVWGSTNWRSARESPGEEGRCSDVLREMEERGQAEAEGGEAPVTPGGSREEQGLWGEQGTIRRGREASHSEQGQPQASQWSIHPDAPRGLTGRWCPWWWR